MFKNQIQKRAPEFKAMAVVDGEFKQIKLSDYKGKFVVLFFVPQGVPSREIRAFSDRNDEFATINVEVVAVSTDSHFSLMLWLNSPPEQGGLGGNMKIPIVADTSKSISRAYGVLNEETGAPFRGLFIIDQKGYLRQYTVNDLAAERSVDETLRLVRGYQFIDDMGRSTLTGNQGP